MSIVSNEHQVDGTSSASCDCIPRLQAINCFDCSNFGEVQVLMAPDNQVLIQILGTFVNGPAIALSSHDDRVSVELKILLATVKVRNLACRSALVLDQRQ